MIEYTKEERSFLLKSLKKEQDPLSDNYILSYNKKPFYISPHLLISIIKNEVNENDWDIKQIGENKKLNEIYI